MIIALAFSLLAVLVPLTLAFALWLCGRRRVPDFWEESVLLTKGFGARRDDVLAGRAWLEKRRLIDVQTTGDDDITLRGVLLRHSHRESARGTVLLLHDRGSSWKLDFSGLAEFLYMRGYHLLFAEQRAHPRSGGFWCTCGVWERFDVRAWTNDLSFRFGDEHPIWILGCGMGGAAALMASSLELYGSVRGIIAEDAYSAPEDYLQRMLHRLIPLPFGPALWLLRLFTTTFAGFSLRDCSAVQEVRESACPILLLHAEDNRDTPPETARGILENCPPKRARLVLFPGAGKGLCRVTDRARYESALDLFLRETAPVSSP